MSLLTYRIQIDVPIASPSGEEPYNDAVKAINDTTGEQVEFDPKDAQSLRNWLRGAWGRGRYLA